MKQSTIIALAALAVAGLYLWSKSSQPKFAPPTSNPGTTGLNSSPDNGSTATSNDTLLQGTESKANTLPGDIGSETQTAS